MKKITVSLKANSYPIVIDQDLQHLGESLGPVISSRGKRAVQALVVTHPYLKLRYGSQIKNCLEKAGLQVQFALLPIGEKIKNLKTLNDLYKKIVQAKLDRSSYMVAFGGGVLGDTAGFAAATYMRGINLIQIPTTLLAMVDSSIGGKVGVDLPFGKNLVGSFYQPKFVGIALSTLVTLPNEEYRNGLAEVIKYGVISDKELFELLERELPASLDLEWVISRCAQIKARVVVQDEKEKLGIREILNFGHTLGHAIETLTSYKVYKHGEAISIGMRAASTMANLLKIFDRDSCMRLEKLIDSAGLPIKLKKSLPAQELLKLLYRDKKVLSQKLRFVLPVKIGKVIVKEVTPELALQGIAAIQP